MSVGVGVGVVKMSKNSARIVVEGTALHQAHLSTSKSHPSPEPPPHLPPPPLHSFCTAGMGQKPTGVLAHFPTGARTRATLRDPRHPLERARRTTHDSPPLVGEPWKTHGYPLSVTSLWWVC